MRNALGLDVDGASSFAAVVTLDSGSARPRKLAMSAVPSPEHDDSIVEATLAAISAATSREGEAPSSVVLAHPLAWNVNRAKRVRRALAAAGLADVRLIDSALAAALGADVQNTAQTGQVIIVVALRDGGADVVAIRKDDSRLFHALVGSLPIVGPREADLDAKLRALVASRVPGGVPEADLADASLSRALEKFAQSIRAARQRLNEDDSTVVGVRLPGRATIVMVERAEFEDAVGPAVRAAIPAMVAAIRATIGSVGSADEILLTGRAAPLPLLRDLLGAELEVPVVVSDPRRAGSFGAAIAAAAAAVPALIAPPVDIAPVGIAPVDTAPVDIAPVDIAPVDIAPVVVPPPLVEPPRVAPIAPRSRAVIVPPTAPPALIVEKVPPKSTTSRGDPAWRGEGPSSEAGSEHVEILWPDATLSQKERARRARRREPLTLLQLWPIGAAAAILVALAGAAASGALTTTPTGTENPNGPVTHSVVSASPSAATGASSGAVVDDQSTQDATVPNATPGTKPSTKSTKKGSTTSTNQGSGSSSSGGSPSVSTSNPSVPTSDPSVPAGDPSVPTGDPSIPTGDPSVPTTDPSIPVPDPAP